MTKTATKPAPLPARAQRHNVREVLPSEPLEFRAGDDTKPPKLVGIAARTGVSYQVDDFGRGFTETIEAGAFSRTLGESPDVVLLVDHSGLPLARTTSRTLELRETSEGLEVTAELDDTDPDVAQLIPKLRRGDMRQMSIAFRVNRQSWNEDYSERVIHEINLAKGDVSVVTFPASPTTQATLRAALDDPDNRELLRRELEIRAADDDTTDNDADDDADADADGDDDGETDDSDDTGKKDDADINDKTEPPAPAAKDDTPTAAEVSKQNELTAGVLDRLAIVAAEAALAAAANE